MTQEAATVREALSYAPVPVFEALEPRLLLAADTLISEFMAANDSALADADGDRSDWIELYNAGDETADLDGWYLTDDPANLTRWRLPAVSLEPGRFLVVFASDKDRTDPAGELHANFCLDRDGEYLALVEPDGLTVAHDFGAQFPQQYTDVSYGYGFTSAGTVKPVLVGSPAKALVPVNDALGTSWTEGAFDDSSWLSGTTGVGYDLSNDLDALIGLDVEAELYNVNTTAYVRVPFTVSTSEPIGALTLRIAYDDGFVVYLNGQQVATVNAPPDPTWNSAAPTWRDGDLEDVFEDIDLTERVGLLQDGPNILAIHVLNVTVTSSDLLVLPELLAELSLEIGTQVGYLDAPTPGTANGSPADGICGATAFSVPHGLFDAPFEVRLTTDTPGAEIYYSTDGSMPTPQTGASYGGPITISRTTTLRAAAYLPDFFPGEVGTQTYIFPLDVRTQDGAGFPVNWGVMPVDDSWRGLYTGDPVPSDYGVDPQVVSDPRYSATFEDDLRTLPTMSLVMDLDDLFDTDTGFYANTYFRGRQWERPTSVELIYPDGADEGFQVNAGIRAHGGLSRTPSRTPKHSMRLYFRGEYGPTKLEYPLFEGTRVAQFDKLVLRASFNHSWHYDADHPQDAFYFGDPWARLAHQEMGYVSPRDVWVHLYVNGLYWGVYGLTERVDEDYCADYFGGEPEDWDIIMRYEQSVGEINVAAGTVDAWMDLLYAAGLREGGTIVSADYDALADLLDLEAFCDWFVLRIFGGDWDWPYNNWYGVRNRNGGKWYFVTWDAEGMFRYLDEDRSTVWHGSWVSEERYRTSPGFLYNQLRVFPEFRQLFADRVHKLMFNDGLLTPHNNVARMDKIVSDLGRAMVGESARWGDAWKSAATAPYTYDDHWLPKLERMRTFYFQQRPAIVLDQYRAIGLYPNIDAPVFAQHGGPIADGFRLTMTAPSGGTIYYCLDGSDPRLPGGAISPAALMYHPTVPPTLDGLVTVKARVLDGGEWSALNEAVFAPDVSTLRITEIMYNPADPTPAEAAAGHDNNDDFEYIEILNVDSAAIDLAGAEFTGDVQFTFPSMLLGAGQRVVIARDLSAFAHRYGVGASGEYGGALGNGGDPIVLRTALGGTILDFAYDDEGGWPEQADGWGWSLELIEPADWGAVADLDAYYGDASHWRGSSLFGGSPGTAGAAPQEAVRIHEVLSHTDPPAVDAIELRNHTAGAIDVSGWYLSDVNTPAAEADYMEYALPAGTVLPGGGYLLLDEGDFNAGGTGFALSGSEGDALWVTSSDGAGGVGGWVDHVVFGAAANGVSLGRYGEGSSDLAPQRSVTLGEVNGYPQVGPVVLSEIVYDPTGTAGDGDLEYVELYNRSAWAVDLWAHHDGQDHGWRLSGAVEYEFASGTTLGAAETLLLVGFDPGDAALREAFVAQYGIGAGVSVAGGWTGRLADEGERVELLWPDAPPVLAPQITPYVLADVVDYGQAGWSDAGGGGQGLHRLEDWLFGDAPTSWRASAPTPGGVDFSGRTPPAVTDHGVSHGSATQIAVTFSGDVSGSVEAGDLVVYNETTGVYVSPATASFDYVGQTARWTFASLASGSYRVRLSAGEVSDGSGYPLDGDGDGVGGDDYVFGFASGTVLMGDADGDGDVDLDDLFTVRNNFGRAGGWAEGDFDGDGVVDLDDLFTVRNNFGASTRAASEESTVLLSPPPSVKAAADGVGAPLAAPALAARARGGTEAEVLSSLAPVLAAGVNLAGYAYAAWPTGLDPLRAADHPSPASRSLTDSGSPIAPTVTTLPYEDTPATSTDETSPSARRSAQPARSAAAALQLGDGLPDVLALPALEMDLADAR